MSDPDPDRLYGDECCDCPTCVECIEAAGRVVERLHRAEELIGQMVLCVAELERLNDGLRCRNIAKLRELCRLNRDLLRARQEER